MSKKARKKHLISVSADSEIKDEELGVVAYPFLRAETDEVKFPCEATVLSPAMLMRSRYGVRRIIEIDVDGKRFVLTLNRMSLRNLIAKYGKNSVDWVDKKIKLVVQVVLGKKAIIAN